MASGKAVKNRGIVLACAMGIGLISWLAVAGDAGDASVLLADMRRAVERLNYRGSVVYLKDQQLESFQVFHSVADGVERERMLSTNTPLREVVRNAQKVTCYFPDTHTVATEARSSRRSILLDIPDDLTQLQGLYRFSLGETEVVAQKTAQLVRIDPRDGYRYGRRLWVDLASKLPLKLELIDDANQSVEQVVFTSISVEPQLPPEALEPSTRTDASWQVKEHQALNADSLQWTLEGVPDGFHMMSYSRLRRSTDNSTVDHIMLSDGLASVSIYVDDMKDDFVVGHPGKVGAINSAARKLDKHLITVIGEVPESTVQAIANGIRQQSSGPTP
ncbi:MAG: transcriptional regulator [Methylococcaceae bacterium]|nr:transcriptional regulator [Methylococcaceae bacterium]